MNSHTTAIEWTGDDGFLDYSSLLGLNNLNLNLSKTIPKNSPLVLKLIEISKRVIELRIQFILTTIPFLWQPLLPFEIYQ